LLFGQPDVSFKPATLLPRTLFVCDICKQNLLLCSDPVGQLQKFACCPCWTNWKLLNLLAPEFGI
jgi:hypothetical protein